MTQYERNVGEDDLTMLPEILKKHDLASGSIKKGRTFG